MKKAGLFVLILFLFAGMLTAQKPLLIVNGEEISSDEFMAVFMKNNINKTSSRAEIDEYLDLFINFRLKVAEAKEMKLDTFKTFMTELDGYRKTLAQPYLTKTEILDKLIAETYDRMLWDLRASHILIKVSENASPADTLKAYRQAIAVRNRALKGESFEKLAVEVSEDESARDRQGSQQNKGNKGDLGFFSALDLVYDFENAAYSMKVGEISMPVRSEFGYHIIKLTDRKPALGKVQTAHILVAVAPDAEDNQKSDAFKRANDLYDRIIAGESYEEIAKEYSDDKGSGMRGGTLPWFGVFRMLPEFLEPLYGMQNGAVAKPVLTSYGYHIIKLIDRKPVGAFDDVKNELKPRVMRDSRYKIATHSFIEKLKIENGFTEYPEALKKFIKAVNDSIYNGSWLAEMTSGMNDAMFITGNRVITQTDFAKYVQSNQNIQKNDDKEMFLRNIYKKFVSDKLIEYENDHLEMKHPAFASLMKEYHDGILLFDLTDKMVWSKALKDSAGLNNFYETVKHNYMWPERVEGTIYSIKDQSLAKKVHKAMIKANKKGTDLNSVITSFSTPEKAIVTEESGIFIKAEHPVFSGVSTTGISAPVQKDDAYIIVRTDRIIQPEPKALRDVKGIVTNEYQNYLEKQWIQDLRSKYSWKVNDDVLKTLYH